MDEKYEPDPEITKFVEDYKEQQRQKLNKMIASTDPSAGVPSAGSPQVTTPLGSNQQANVTPVSQHITNDSPYYSSDSCKVCHESEYAAWQKDKHSQALQVLIKESKVIPECLPCHSEMFRKTNRLTISSNASVGVECASCHLSVIPHGTEYKKKGPTEQDRNACLACHTKERSPDFQMEPYWEKAKHKS
jgi:hypothetical protein